MISLRACSISSLLVYMPHARGGPSEGSAWIRIERSRDGVVEEEIAGIGFEGSWTFFFKGMIVGGSMNTDEESVRGKDMKGRYERGGVAKC